MTKHVSEVQIVKILEEFRSGVQVEELCRTYGVARSTLYKWRDKYADMPLSEVKRIKQLEQENRKLEMSPMD